MRMTRSMSGWFLVVAGEGPELGGHFGAGGVAFAGEDGGEAAQIGPAFVAVVGNAGLHQHRAEIGVAEAQRAEFDS